MIIINNKKFILKSDKKSKDYIGYYRNNKNDISLYNLDNEKIAIINKEERELLKCKKLKNNKYFYNFDDIKEIGKWNTFIEKWENLNNIVRQLKPEDLEKISKKYNNIKDIKDKATQLCIYGFENDLSVNDNKNLFKISFNKDELIELWNYCQVFKTMGYKDEIYNSLYDYGYFD